MRVPDHPTTWLGSLEANHRFAARLWRTAKWWGHPPEAWSHGAFLPKSALSIGLGHFQGV